MEESEKQLEADRKLRFFRDLVSEKNVSDIDAVLNFFDDGSRAAAFEHYWKKLQIVESKDVDLDLLRVCITLLPPSNRREELSYQSLSDHILNKIPGETQDPMHLYKLAELSLSNDVLGWRIFTQLINRVSDVNQETSSQKTGEITYHETSASQEQHSHRVLSYLKFIKCSFWLPPERRHYITPELPKVLVDLLGQDDFDEIAHDVLSALLSLLGKPTNVLPPEDEPMPPCLSSNPGSSNLCLTNSIINEQLWTRISELPSQYFSSSSSKIFKTWFQWISHALAYTIDSQGIYDPLYWSRLRSGLLNGFTDQRKYCLGILRQSLSLARRSIDTPLLTFDIARKPLYEMQYERYCALFETIVLDGYLNQVQACLPELVPLFASTSVISTGWTTVLLSAALDPRVTTGLRKLVGMWYITYVTKAGGAIVDHTDFLVDGFLPWATQGSLFTSSIRSTRRHTTCVHSDALSCVISTFLAAMTALPSQRKLVQDVLHFILNTRGRIFQFATLSLLEGLLTGLKQQCALEYLEAADLDLILQVSRLTGFPVTADLCVAYCAEFYEATSSLLSFRDVPGHEVFKSRLAVLREDKHLTSGVKPNNAGSLQQFSQQLESSLHKTIQDDLFMAACENLRAILDEDQKEPEAYSELCNILEALWEEADRQEFRRVVILSIPPVFFHPTCIRICAQYMNSTRGEQHPLGTLLTKAVNNLQRLSEGRTYLLSDLVYSLRKACFSNPSTPVILPIEDFLVRLVENPPSPKKEFLFEVAAAEKLQQFFPRRDYTYYYGKREWNAYASIVDLLNRFPSQQIDVARRVLDRLLAPWRNQKAPIPIISKWKEVFQLQAMLVLIDFCIFKDNAPLYMESFMHALLLEQWPRYRFMLEWIIARICYRYPRKAEDILTDLTNLDENSPVQVASLIKLAVLTAPLLDSEDFTLKLMIQLIPFSASPKVQIRHEAQWSFPIVFSFAVQKGWRSVIDNPALRALDTYIRTLDKFSAPAFSIRTLRLDVLADYTIAGIFEGQYLSLETPEPERISHEDFISLLAEDEAAQLEIPPARLPLGKSTHESDTSAPDLAVEQMGTVDYTDSTQNFFQTKAGFDFKSLLPPTGPPGIQRKRPASVILIASLIDNPTNLGGLSRISESFGLSALYIDDIRKTAHKDFKATSVNSEKHFPIQELKIPAVPDFIIDMKRQGYEVVGIEQTDRSGLLGEEDGNGKGVGTLPRKCVLVLGSEKGGITREVLSVLDRCVEIRTVGVTRSLNVQTAGGIAVYEWWREWGHRQD